MPFRLLVRRTPVYSVVFADGEKAYGVGNWVGPQTFQAKTAPHYVTGKTILTIFFGLAIVDLLGLRVVNWLDNRRRNKLEAAGQAPHQPEDAAARDLTDKEQPAFRYML